MNQTALRYFISAANHLNFSKAALDCHITQASFSRQIASLEEEIGTPLFIRGKNGVTLTAAGYYLLDCVHSFLDTHDNIIYNCRRCSQELAPLLRIGLGPVEHLLIQKPLKILHDRYPEMAVNIMSYTYKILTSRFRHMSIDFGVCTERCTPEMNAMNVSTIYRQPWQVVAHKDHPFWNLPRNKQATLEHQIVITNYNNDLDEIRRYCTDNRLDIDGYYEANFLQAQYAYLQAGIGISLQPPFIRESLPGDLRMEDVLEVPLAPRFVTVCDAKISNPSVEAFKEICEEYFSK